MFGTGNLPCCSNALSSHSVTSEPTAATFLATNRGGGLLSESIDQPMGALIALAGYRRNTPPTVLTLGNLFFGLATSITVIALAPAMCDGRVPHLVVGLVALVLWHLAYWFDCADGQLARVAKKTSPAGARIDILCDIAVQIALVAAVSSVAVRYTPRTPVWFVATFAAGWLINLVTSVLAKGDDAQSLVTSRSLAVRVIKLSRDFSAMITLIALVIAFVPKFLVWVMVAFTAVNVLFLLASIAATARESIRTTSAER
jgi:phosphatidylglycerophosphate synthase